MLFTGLYCFSGGSPLKSVEPSSISMLEKLRSQKNDLQEKIDFINTVRPISLSDHEKISSLLQIQFQLESQYKTSMSNKIVWPPATSFGTLRTKEAIQEIYDKMNCARETLTDPLSPSECKGIVQQSLFFSIPNFDFVQGIPTEYLHSVCIGLIKKLIELCFNVGENRKRITTRELLSANSFNTYMSHVRVPREFSR